MKSNLVWRSRPIEDTGGKRVAGQGKYNDKGKKMGLTNIEPIDDEAIREGMRKVLDRLREKREATERADKAWADAVIKTVMGEEYPLCAPHPKDGYIEFEPTSMAGGGGFAEYDTLQSGINPKDLIGAKKPDLSLIPTTAMVYMAKCMTNGAAKYGPFNWREEGKPVQTRTYVAAAMRHLIAYLDGEDNAKDSGLPHLGHAMAGIAVLVDAIECGNSVDNRPNPGPAPRLIDDD